MNTNETTARKTMKDLRELVADRESELAPGSETCILGVFVDEYGYMAGPDDEEKDVTDSYSVYMEAYSRLELYLIDGVDFELADLFI